MECRREKVRVFQWMIYFSTEEVIRAISIFEAYPNVYSGLEFQYSNRKIMIKTPS
jgi:hypothetical protein